MLLANHDSIDPDLFRAHPQPRYFHGAIGHLRYGRQRPIRARVTERFEYFFGLFLEPSLPVQLRSAFAKSITSAFIGLNVFTVIYMNLPSRLIEGGKPLTTKLRQYANFTGLETQWEMFSTAKGNDWRLLIEGDCPNQGSLKLPIAGQAPRSFWQDHLFDFKEGKLKCNIALDPISRRAYAEHLCREYSCASGERMRRVRISMLFQSILDPREALKRHHHLAPVIRRETVEDLSCKQLQDGIISSSTKSILPP